MSESRDDGFEQDDGFGCFDDPRALDDVRQRVLESVGPEYGWGILYGIGLNQGLVDGLRVARGFEGPLEEGPQLTGAPIQLLFSPAGLQPGDRLRGSLRSSLEAELHLERDLPARAPICWVSAGYAAGWYTAILGEPHVVKETSCRASGADRCEFEARPLRRWIEAADSWLKTLLPYLDFERMRAAALEKLAALEVPVREGTMMGGFDPMSPAAHVWGSVMVLPYSGRHDCEAALEAIQQDLGPSQLQVVIVDLTGAEVDSVEATGLLWLIDTLSSMGLETVLVGLSDEAAERYLRPGSCLALPLRAPDITSGISLAFQISQPAASDT